MASSYTAPTALDVGSASAVVVMDSAEDFLLALGATITRRKPNSLKALVKHPDGLETNVKFTHQVLEDKGVLELTRRSGDTLLFHLLLRMMKNEEDGSGFFAGQLIAPPTPPEKKALEKVRPPVFFVPLAAPCTPNLRPSPPPVRDVSPLRLLAADKRKAEEM